MAEDFVGDFAENFAEEASHNYNNPSEKPKQSETIEATGKNGATGEG